MCCFSNAPAFEAVTNTQIFARLTAPDRQVLAYSMTVTARESLAMILPIPVPPHSDEGAVTFINLEGYADFFDDLSRGFPAPQPRGMPIALGMPERSATLKVHDVGAFEASFVPTVDDFSRLDPRFTLDTAVWDRLPLYRDYGFAVFKLKGFAASGWGLSRLLSRGGAVAKTIHPMAFSFPTRRPGALFFPTVHIHDGSVHRTAHFDHTLYGQADGQQADWRVSSGPARGFVDAGRTKGLVDGGRPCLRRKMVGTLPNRDVWL